MVALFNEFSNYAYSSISKSSKRHPTTGSSWSFIKHLGHFYPLTLNRFSKGFCNGLVMTHRKITIWSQHPTDPLTHCFIFWLASFGFWFNFACKAFGLLKFGQSRFSVWCTFFFKSSDEPLRLYGSVWKKTGKFSPKIGYGGFEAWQRKIPRM